MAPSLIEVLETHHRDNWGWALACCNWQHNLADDVLQESYLRVLDGRAKFGGRSSERAWFFGVIKYVAAELARRQSRHGLKLFQNSPASELISDPEINLNSIESDQANRLLQKALAAIPQRQREVLHLVFYSELTIEDAASILDISLGSARTHYHRGKARLAELLEIDDE